MILEMMSLSLFLVDPHRRRHHFHFRDFRTDALTKAAATDKQLTIRIFLEDL